MSRAEAWRWELGVPSQVGEREAGTQTYFPMPFQAHMDFIAEAAILVNQRGQDSDASEGKEENYPLGLR